ncbi:dTMP kinase [Cerasicoccus fimbriatus]|uniref:dTMP kinase n=1 Tax=Cerasicoccus fimbriatus TaxID=3014554 RepID=UPI0022B365E1|nr:dTMP kinase [Cerasicoccus sp. TK19100]
MTENGGILISFEGSEGSGKSTQIAQLADKIRAAGREVLLTREPGGTAIGEEIRHLLKHADAGFGMCPETELLLFAASRAQLVREVIIPALKEGKVILCDRFLDSTTVYQGVARQLSEDPVSAINSFAVGDAMPHLTIVVDVPAEIGLQRAAQRASDLPDRMEQENIEFYQSVRKGYLILAEQMPERFFVVDGSLAVHDVADLIWAEVSEIFDIG